MQLKLRLVISALTASGCTSEGLPVMICVNVCSYRFYMAQRHTDWKNRMEGNQNSGNKRV